MKKNMVILLKKKPNKVSPKEVFYNQKRQKQQQYIYIFLQKRASKTIAKILNYYLVSVFQFKLSKNIKKLLLHLFKINPGLYNLSNLNYLKIDF